MTLGQATDGDADSQTCRGFSRRKMKLEGGHLETLPLRTATEGCSKRVMSAQGHGGFSRARAAPLLVDSGGLHERKREQSPQLIIIMLCSFCLVADVSAVSSTTDSAFRRGSSRDFTMSFGAPVPSSRGGSAASPVQHLALAKL